MDVTPGEEKWTFVLLAADALLAGELDRIAGVLARRGLRPAVCQVLPFDARAMRAMFYVGTEPPVPDPWVACYDDLYRLAPACLLVLERPAGGACAAMLACKGTTRPEHAARGTVRRTGENWYFNLVHSPDDAAAATAELSALLGRDGAERLIAAALAADPRLGRLTGLAALRRRLPAFHGPEALSPRAAVERVLGRVVQRLAIALGADARPALLEADERLAQAGTAARDVASALRALAEPLGDRALVTGLERLAGAGPARDGLALLARSGVYVSPLERAAGAREPAPVSPPAPAPR